MSELFFCDGFSCVADGGVPEMYPKDSQRGSQKGFPDGVPRGFHGFPGVSSMTLSKTSEPSSSFCLLSFADF